MLVRCVIRRSVPEFNVLLSKLSKEAECMFGMLMLRV